MSKQDYYEILGISPNAGDKDIKQAYRRIAMEMHPDRNPDNPEAEESFKKAAEAYDVLSNPEKREIYDRYGHEGLRGQTGFTGVEDIFSSFGDIFSDFFGGDIFGGHRRSRPPRPARGSDLRYDLDLTFAEAMRGTKKELKLQHLRKCDTCDGTGAKKGSTPEACSTCGGHGQVVQRTGFMTLATTCPSCGGKGVWIRTPCKECDGSGRAPFTKTVSAVVPAGVDTGMRLRLAGEGEHPEGGGEPGDLYVFISVDQDVEFEREGDNLYSKVRVSYTQAILGHRLTFELIDEQIVLDLPPGTQPGEQIRISGKGAPRVGRGSSGDLIVIVEVELPRHLSERERNLLNELNALQSEKAS